MCITTVDQRASPQALLHPRAGTGQTQVFTGLHSFDSLLHLHTVLLKYVTVAARRARLVRLRVGMVVMLLKQRTTS